MAIGRYSGLAGGLVAGYGVGSRARGDYDQRKSNENNKFARGEYFKAETPEQKNEVMQGMVTDNPAAANQFMQLLDSQSNMQNKTLKLQTEQLGSLSAWAVETGDPKIAMERLAQIRESYIDTGKLSPEVAKQFPNSEDPNAYTRLQMNAAVAAKIDDLFDAYFRTRDTREKGEKDKGVDDHKLTNTLKKQEHKANLDQNLEKAKHGYRSDEKAIGGTNTSASTKSDNAALRKNYSRIAKETVLSDDGFTETPKWTEKQAKSIAHKKMEYMNGGMDDLDAEDKAKVDVGGEGNSSDSTNGGLSEAATGEVNGVKYRKLGRR